MKILIKILAICYFFTSSMSMVFAQEFVQNENTQTQKKDHSFKADRLFFGGGLGFQFGDIDLISIAPEVGYRFTDRFALGVGISYYYISTTTNNQGFSTDIYGGKVFGRYIVFENLFVHTEYEALNMETQYFNPTLLPDQDRFTVGSFLVGAGYKFRLGSNSYLNLLVLWNLNETVYSPYSNPILRMNFEF
jgi:hypothetical protein